MSYPVNYTTKKYRPRDLTEKQLAFCEAYLAEGIPNKAAKIAGYKSDGRAAGYLLGCKRVKAYLTSRQKHMVNVPVTFEVKAERLMHVIDEAIPLDKELTPKVDTGIKAIQELNRMQGHYAPTQNQNVNVNVDADDKVANALFDKLLTNSTRDY